MLIHNGSLIVSWKYPHINSFSFNLFVNLRWVGSYNQCLFGTASLHFFWVLLDNNLKKRESRWNDCFREKELRRKVLLFFWFLHFSSGVFYWFPIKFVRYKWYCNNCSSLCIVTSNLTETSWWDKKFNYSKGLRGGVSVCV